MTRIDISYNYLRNSGVISLAYVFKSLVNLVHLDIGDNHVGDSGAAAIAVGCKPFCFVRPHQSNAGERVRSLAHFRSHTFVCTSVIHHFKFEGRAALQEATSASKKLQTLALGGNRISDPGLTAISSSMAPSLSTLNFNFNCVADDGATSLVPLSLPSMFALFLLPCWILAGFQMALACRPLVELQWFNVCLIGCMQANALRAGSASLTCLYLSGNSIGSAGIQDLAGMHPVTCVCRREWFLSSHFILSCPFLIRETEAAFLLLSAVFFSRRDAFFCDGSHPFSSCLTDAVSKHKGLKQIYLRGNPLDSNARSSLEKVAQHHPSLVIFV